MPVSGRATKNAAEIQAATQAITLAYEHDFQRLCIRADSEILLSAINGYLLEDDYRLANDEDLELLGEAIERFESWGSLKWEKISAGNHGNEAADGLARKGAAKYCRN